MRQTQKRDMIQDELSPMNKFRPFSECLERSEGHLCLQHFNKPPWISKRPEKWVAVVGSNSVVITWGWWMRKWHSPCKDKSSFLKQLYLALMSGDLYCSGGNAGNYWNNPRFRGNARNTRLKKKPHEDPKRFALRAEIFLDTGHCCTRLINLSLV